MRNLRLIVVAGVFFVLGVVFGSMPIQWTSKQRESSGCP